MAGAAVAQTDAKMIDTAAYEARKDPLAATPVVAPGVDARVGGKDLVQLRRRPAAPKSRVAGMVMRTLRLSNGVRVNLDRCGTLYWRHIDGKRSLADIEKALRRELSLGRKESTKAVIEFTKQLMLRGLICLRLPGQPVEENGNGDG